MFSAEPADPRLSKAALDLAPLFKAPNRALSRTLIDIDLANDTPPEWLKKPTLENLLAVYPAKALKEGLSGAATVKCTVQTNGLVRACSVTKEDRPGMGFGPAAVALSSTFLFKPATRDGSPVEAEVFVANPWTEDGLPADGAHVRMPIKMNYDPTTAPPAPAPAPTPATKP